MRSNEYAQDTGALKTDNGFCCLGVACEIYREETGLGEWGEDGVFLWELDGEEFEHEGDLPPPVVAWLGVGSPNPDVLDDLEDEDASGDNDWQLTTVNDDWQYDFGQISEMIERKYFS